DWTLVLSPLRMFLRRTPPNGHQGAPCARVDARTIVRLHSETWPPQQGRRRARVSMTRQLRERGQLAVTALLLAPTALFFYLLHHPELDRIYQIPVPHFYIVSATSLAALILAIVVGIASVRSRAPRTFFVAAGFLAIAGIFSVHGLSTPGEHMF